MQELNAIDVLTKLVSEFANVSAETISGEHRLVEDLGIVGDDASALLANVAETFSLDMSEFDFGVYFPDEAGASMHAVPALRSYNRSRMPLLKMFHQLNYRMWSLFARQDGLQDNYRR